MSVGMAGLLLFVPMCGYTLYIYGIGSPPCGWRAEVFVSFVRRQCAVRAWPWVYRLSFSMSLKYL